MIERPSWLARVLDSRGQTAGTGIAVTDELVITCGHVVAGPGATVRVGFPFAGHESEAVVVHHVFEPDGAADLAVLKLRDPLRDDPETPLHRAVRFAGRKARLRGFPERDEPVSPIANVELSGFSRPGWVQINPTGARGWSVHKGFSGGPVWDDAVGAVIGMVVAKHANDTGHLLTLDFLCELWPPLAEHIRMPPTMGGTEAWHWWPRARGIQHDTETVWRFRGRRKAIEEITAALGGEPRSVAVGPVSNIEPGAIAPAHEREPAAGDDPLSREPAATVPSREPVIAARRKPLIVTGSPGVGKSAVLARIVTTSHPPWAGRLPADDSEPRAELGSVDCAVHAQGKTALEVAQAIALAAGVHDLADLNHFQTMLREAVRGRDRFNIVIDAVDEAVDAMQAGAILADVIAPLAEFPAVRVVAGSRMHLGTRQLLSTSHSSFDLLDLDELNNFELADLENYALATLRLDGEPRHDNPYNDPSVAKPLALRVAHIADRNFLVAGLVARGHALYDTKAAAPESLRSTENVDDAFRAYLARLAPVDGIEADRLLTVLSFAEAPGFTAELWAVAVEALDGITIHPRRLEAFARTATASFLIEQTGDEGPVFRLFHQALIDVAQDWRIIGDADLAVLCESRLTTAFLDHAHSTGWAAAPQYLRRSLVAHAARGDQVDGLLKDVEFLVHADTGQLLDHVVFAEGETSSLHAAVYRMASGRLHAAEPDQRRAVLAYNAHLLGADDLAKRLAEPPLPSYPLTWRPQWVKSGFVDSRIHTTLTRSAGLIDAISCAQVGNRTIAAMRDWELDDTPGADPDAVVKLRIWDLASGRQIRPPFQIPGEQTPDGLMIEPVGPSIIDVGGQLVAVTLPDHGVCPQPTVNLWPLDAEPDLDGDFGPHRASDIIAFVKSDEYTAVVTARGSDGAMLWNLATRERIGRTVCLGTSPDYFPGSVTFVDGQPVIAVIDQDKAQLWNFTTGERMDCAVLGYQIAVSCGTVDGRPIVVGRITSNQFGVWDLVSGDSIVHILRPDGHGRRRFRISMATGVSVTRSFFRVLGFLLNDGGRVDAFLDDDNATSHQSLTDDGAFVAVCTEVNGALVAVIAFSETVQVLDLESTWGIGDAQDQADETVFDIAVTTVDDRPHVVTLSTSDNGLKMRYAVTGELLHTPHRMRVDDGEAVQCLRDGKRPAVITVEEGTSVYERCMTTGEVLSGRRFVVEDKWVTTMITCQIVSSAVVVAVIVEGDMRVLRWDTTASRIPGLFRFPPMETNVPLSRDGIDGRNETAENGDCTLVNGRLTAAIGTSLGRVHVYDVASGTRTACFDFGPTNTIHKDEITALTCVDIDGISTVIAGTGFGAVRSWDLKTSREIRRFKPRVPVIDNSAVGQLHKIRTLVHGTVNGRPTLFAGTRFGDVHVFDLDTGRTTAVIPFNDRIEALAVLHGDRLIVASGKELAMLKYHPR